MSTSAQPGRRRDDVGSNHVPPDLAVGDYWYDTGSWHVACALWPDGDVSHITDFVIANLANHDVTEHEDGTITASPSILVTDSTGRSWHGFLEHGMLRTA